jgi:uncharacterized membrane protein
MRGVAIGIWPACAAWRMLVRARCVREMPWKWLLLAILTTVLLHGCHGDEDNELFAPSLTVTHRR